jgi:hypothetical protein
LTLAFTPSVTGVTGDPALMFLAAGGRNLSVQVCVGSQTAFYNGQSQFAFQTGTTAGKLTFTLTFEGQDPVVQTIVILPAPVALTSIKGVRQSPSLVVTVTGYDNTYSAGKLSFTFYNTAGAAMSQGVPSMPMRHSRSSCTSSTRTATAEHSNCRRVFRSPGM